MKILPFLTLAIVFSSTSLFSQMQKLSGPYQINRSNEINIMTVARTNPNVIYMIEFYPRKIIKSSNEGSSWTVLQSTTAEVISVSGANENYVITEKQRSSDGGQTWSNVSFIVDEFVLEPLIFKPNSNSTLYCIGFNDIRKSSDFGFTWVILSHPPTNQINDYEKLIVDYNNPQHLYVIISTHNISNAGYLAKSTDEGVTWTSYQIATSDQFSIWTGCIDPNNSSIFYAGRNDSPNFYKSTNGGINWNAVTLQTGGLGVVDISVAKQNSSNMFICLNNGDDTSKYLMKSEDAGQTWSKSFGNGFYTGCEKMFSTTANQLYVKFSNGLFLSKDNGNFFKSIGFYISNLGAWVSSNQVLYTWSKYYYKSTDFGSTWTAILEGGQNNSNSLFISQQNSNRLFAVYHWKKIAVSNDGGWNWSTILIPNLAFVESIYVNKTNENIMFARCDGTYVKSTNGGETWSSMNVPTNEDGNFLRLRTSDINTLFLISKSPSPGKIYKSTNMGANWNILSIPLGSNENINDLQILNSNRLLLSARSFFISDNQGNTWSKVYNYTESIYTTDIFFNPNNSSTFFSHTTNYDKLVGSNNGGTMWWNSNQGLPSTLHYIHMGSLSSQGNLLVAADSNLYYGTPVISIKPINVNVPKNTKLVNNYPNPFNPSTKIKFDIAAEMHNAVRNVNLTVYDVLGKETAVLVNEAVKPGTYEAEWNASSYPSGIYFARLTAGEYKKTIKMVLTK